MTSRVGYKCIKISFIMLLHKNSTLCKQKLAQNKQDKFGMKFIMLPNEYKYSKDIILK